MVKRRDAMEALKRGLNAASPSAVAVATALGFDIAKLDAIAPEPLIDDDTRVHVAAGVRAQAERLADRFEAAHRALAKLRSVQRLPLASREALTAAVGDLTRSLALLRRTLRAFSADLSALESDGRGLVTRAYRRVGGAL